MVSSHEPKNSCEVLVYQCSNVRYGIFRLRFQRSISANYFSQITYKASSGMEGERMHVFFGDDWIELWHIKTYNGKTSKIFFSETARPTAYRFMSWIICYFCLVFVMLLCA